MQLNCYLLPSDLERLETALRQAVPLEIASGFDKDGTIRSLSTLVVDQMGLTPLRVYLVPEWLSPASERLSEAVRGGTHVDITEVPAVEFDRCYSDATLIRRGRLYAVRHQTPDPVHAAFDERVNRWLTSLFKAAREALIRQPDGTYIGPDAKAAVASGQLLLVDT
jgi:hypothetical protein